MSIGVMDRVIDYRDTEAVGSRKIEVPNITSRYVIRTSSRPCSLAPHPHQPALHCVEDAMLPTIMLITIVSQGSGDEVVASACNLG